MLNIDLVQTPHNLVQGLNLLFGLLIGHAIADFPLQGEFLARFKSRHNQNPTAEWPPGIWVHCLLAHSLVQAGFVWLISGRIVLGFAEFIVHTIFDFVKCENLTGFHTDQLLHVVTKVVFVIAIIRGGVA